MKNNRLLICIVKEDKLKTPPVCNGQAGKLNSFLFWKDDKILTFQMPKGHIFHNSEILRRTFL